MTHAITRRRILQGVAAAAGLGAFGSMSGLERAALAAAGERKFLFFFASGGWDATPLDPKFGPDGVSPVGGTDMDPDTTLGRIGALSWSSGPDRRAMDRYFRRWRSVTQLIRGVNVHSAGHEAGMRWMMTGTSASSMSDWPTRLAATGRADYPIPHLVFSGPSYPGNLGAAVVRGGGATLLSLVDGSINGQVERPTAVFPAPMDSAMDAVLRDRMRRFAGSRTSFAHSRALEMLASHDRSAELEARRFEAGLQRGTDSLLDRAILATELMRLGLSRCAMLNIPGGWDTHGGNQDVGPQLDDFFNDLDALMVHLASTPGASATRLIDEVTIVVLSELGRTPKFNGSMGRDHWPYTSMLVAGSGVRGDHVSGATDEGFQQLPIDLSTGLPDAAGAALGTEHVGVALLRLGGVDPESALPGVPGLDSLLRSRA